mgnify:CR=1 FL=1
MDRKLYFRELLRLQTERMSGQFVPSAREYHHLYGLTHQRLARARAKKGRATERDPSDDVDGNDAAAKVMILAGLVFGRQLRRDEVRLLVAGRNDGSIRHARFVDAHTVLVEEPTVRSTITAKNLNLHQLAAGEALLAEQADLVRRVDLDGVREHALRAASLIVSARQLATSSAPTSRISNAAPRS